MEGKRSVLTDKPGERPGRSMFGGGRSRTSLKGSDGVILSFLEGGRRLSGSINIILLPLRKEEVLTDLRLHSMLKKGI